MGVCKNNTLICHLPPKKRKRSPFLLKLCSPEGKNVYLSRMCSLRGLKAEQDDSALSPGQRTEQQRAGLLAAGTGPRPRPLALLLAPVLPPRRAETPEKVWPRVIPPQSRVEAAGLACGNRHASPRGEPGGRPPPDRGSVLLGKPEAAISCWLRRQWKKREEGGMQRVRWHLPFLAQPRHFPIVSGLGHTILFSGRPGPGPERFTRRAPGPSHCPGSHSADLWAPGGVNSLRVCFWVWLVWG